MKTTLETIKESVYGNPGLGRRELVELTGLDIRTVASGVEKLARQGLVEARRDDKRRVGRTGMLYYPADPARLAFAGVYIDLREMMATIKSADGKILREYREAFTLDWASINHTARRLNKVVTKLADDAGLKTCAIALTIRERRGTAFDNGVGRLLASLSGLPVEVGSPIEAFSWSIRMRNPDMKRIVVVHFGSTRIGMSLVEGFEMKGAAAKFADELSHMTVDKNGPPCYCGKNGCLEYYVHGFSMEEEYRDRMGLGPLDKVGMAELSKGGDPVAAEIMAAAERHTGHALRKILAKFSPDMLCLLVLSHDASVLEMADVTGGKWIPPGRRGAFKFEVVSVAENPGPACASVTADRAVFLGLPREWRVEA